MPPKKEDKRRQTTAALKPEIITEVERLAAVERRTRASMIELLLEEAIAARAAKGSAG